MRTAGRSLCGPRGGIREGGGLADLRRAVEEAGGEMRLTAVPEFEMKLIFRQEKSKL